MPHNKYQDNFLSTQLLNWFDQHGRHDLPWQHPRSLYRVWVSEIMLQQTQVTTVIPYFERFMARFPDVATLAKATEDEVLHLWSGLGYYARGRNLHKAARLIHQQYNGQFPEDFETLLALPGIGRSTAAAILAQALGQRHVIMDGNVKRVLSRFYAIEGWSGKKAVENQLWALSESVTPETHVTDYTQAIMDFGATLCKRGKPDCLNCPLNKHCLAYKQDTVANFPTPKPRKTLPVKQTRMLILQNNHNHILLLKRPPSGIWGGLWSLPECDENTDITHFCQQHLGLDINLGQPGNPLRHKFSHFHLDIQPINAHAKIRENAVMVADERVWYNTQQPDIRGLPAPVKQLLERYALEKLAANKGDNP